MLFRDANDFLKMFLLLDRVEHECRNCFPRYAEAHLGSSAFPASVAHVFFLSKAWRTSDRPIKTAALHDLFHGERITHVLSQDEVDDPIRNTGKMRGCRKNDEPFHTRTLHCPSRSECAVAKN